MRREQVAIGRVIEQDIDATVAQLVEHLGGLAAIVPPGSRVLVKPNFVFPPTDRGITHSELVEAVVRLVRQAAPAEIVIAEGAADVYTGQAFRFMSMNRVAARYGAKLVDLNLEEGVRKPVPDGLGREFLMVPRSVAECDVFISLPVFKLWGDSPLSLSLKNLIGLYGGRYYGHNHDSKQRADVPWYALPGDVGELDGAHQPDVASAIVAQNCVVPTHLAIVDALEGGDGRGNFIRLDTLVAGRNALATDTVCLAMSGMDAREHRTFALAQQYGLGPNTLDEIEIVGEPLASVAFDLRRLHQGVLAMPLPYCLNLLNLDELRQITRAWRVYALDPAAPETGDRPALLSYIQDLMRAPGYYARALGCCTDLALALVELIMEMGGTSGSYTALRDAFGARHGAAESLYFLPAFRVLTRLGLAYLVDSATRPYVLLPEGLAEAYRQLKA